MKYPMRYVQCKAWGHGRWERYTPAPGEFKNPQFGRHTFQLCPDCGTVRYRHINRVTGAYCDRGWSYRQPKSYKPVKPLARQDFRRMYFRGSAKPARNQRHLRAVG